MNKMKNKVLGGIVAVLLITGTLAYFTDYKQTTIEGTAGTLKLDEVTVNWLDESLLLPGGEKEFIVNVENLGTIGAEVRVRLVVEPDGFTGIDVLKDDVSIGGENEEILLVTALVNGTEEVIKSDATTTLSANAKIAMGENVGNEAQGKTTTVSVIVEARQYTNAHAVEWTTLATETLKVSDALTINTVKATK